MGLIERSGKKVLITDLHGSLVKSNPNKPLSTLLNPSLPHSKPALGGASELLVGFKPRLRIALAVLDRGPFLDLLH